MAESQNTEELQEDAPVCEWCDTIITKENESEAVEQGSKYGKKLFCCQSCCDEFNYESRFDSGFDDDDYLIDGVGFADPGGRSALRAETPNNPRIHPCPTCGRENMLTRLDVAAGYQCDYCADAAEGIGY